MRTVPLEAAGARTPEALREFLLQCQAGAARAGRPHLVSISLEVDALDPLAVLESIFEPGEPHFYVERPAERLAVAGAEAAAVFNASGPGRFEACQSFIDSTLEHAFAVGDMSAPFAGPLFFAAFAFSDEAEAGDPFPAATLFVPRWQVAHHSGRTVAVANLMVDPTSPVDALAERVWRAHAKFTAFDYAAPEFSGAAAPRAGVSEVGGAGAYADAVGRALRDIGEGTIEKIVLARAKDLSAFETLHPLRVLNGLRQRFPDCFAFSVANGRGQSFIGASPERLLRVESGRLLTEALAGSAPRGDTASGDAALPAARSQAGVFGTAGHAKVRQCAAPAHPGGRRLAPVGEASRRPREPSPHAGCRRSAEGRGTRPHSRVRGVFARPLRRGAGLGGRQGGRGVFCRPALGCDRRGGGPTLRRRRDRGGIVTPERAGRNRDEV